MESFKVRARDCGVKFLDFVVEGLEIEDIKECDKVAGLISSVLRCIVWAPVNAVKLRSEKWISEGY